MQGIRAHLERDIRAFMHRHQLSVLRIQSLLMWENTLHSILAMVAAVAGVWLFESSGVSCVCLSALAAACFILRDYLHSSSSCSGGSSSNREEMQALAESGSNGRSRSSVSELASCLAEWFEYAWLLCAAASALRKLHPGWFCAATSAASLALIALSRAVSGTVVSTLIVILMFSWPLTAVSYVLPRLYLYFEPMRMKYSSKAKYTIDICDDECEHPSETAAPPQPPSGRSSSSLLGSFMLDVSEMPSHEDSGCDSMFAISSVMSPSSEAFVRTEGRTFDGAALAELDFTLSEHGSRVDGAGSGCGSDFSDGGRWAPGDVHFSACDAQQDERCRAPARLEARSRPAVEASKTEAVSVRSAAATQVLPQLVPQQPLLGSGFVQLPSGLLRAVAQTFRDAASHLPIAASIWPATGTRIGATAAMATEPTGDDSDFELVTTEDFHDDSSEWEVRPCES